MVHQYLTKKRLLSRQDVQSCSQVPTWPKTSVFLMGCHPLRGISSQLGKSPELCQIVNSRITQRSIQDKTIVSTAIPAITNDFHGLNDIGW